MPGISDFTPDIPDIDPPKKKRGISSSIPTGRSQSTMNFGRPTNVDISKYLPYMPEGVNSDFDIDKIRARRQGWLEQTGRTLGNTLANIPMGIVEAAGYVPELFDDAHDYDNAIISKMQQWHNPFGEVFRENPNQVFDLADPAWWMNNVGQLVESVAEFAVPGAAGAKLFGAIGKASSMALKLGMFGDKVARGVGMAATSAYLAYTEGAMSGNQIFKEVYQNQYQKLLKQGATPQEAHDGATTMAGEGAATTVKINTAINTALNLAAISPLFRNSENKINQWFMNQGARQEGETLANWGKRMSAAAAESPELLKALKYRDGLTSHVANMIGEGIEEVNTQYAEQKGRQRGGMEVAKGLNFIDDYFKKVGNQEGLLNFVLGAFGGIGHTVLLDNLPIHKVTDYSAKPGEGEKYPTKIVSARTKDAMGNKQYFENIKDALVTDINWYTKKNEELDKAVASGDHFKAGQLRQEMLNVQSLNSVMTGTTSAWQQEYRGIAALDNTKNVGDDVRKQIAELQQVQPKSAEEATAVQQQVEQLTAQLKKVDGKTEAMLRGFARDQNDNSYKETANRSIQDLDYLQKTYDNMRTNYYTGEPHTDDLTQALFVRTAEQHFNKRLIDEEDQAIAKEESLMNSLATYNGRIEVANRMAKHLETDRKNLMQAAEDNNLPELKRIAGKYGIIANKDSDVNAAVKKLVEKLSGRIDAHKKSVADAKALVETETGYTAWAEKNPGKKISDYLEHLAQENPIDARFTQRRVNLEKAKTEWEISQQGLEQLKSESGIHNFLAAAGKHLAERKARIELKNLNDKIELFKRINDKKAAAKLSREQKEIARKMLHEELRSNITESNRIKAELKALQERYNELDNSRGIRNNIKKRQVQSQIEQLKSQLALLEEQRKVIDQQLENINQDIAKAETVEATAENITRDDANDETVQEENAQAVVHDSQIADPVVRQEATTELSLTDEKAELEKLLQEAETVAVQSTPVVEATLPEIEVVVAKQVEEVKQIVEEAPPAEVVLGNGLAVDPVVVTAAQTETVTTEQAQETVQKNLETVVEQVVENTVTAEDEAVIAKEEKIEKAQVKSYVSDLVKKSMNGIKLPKLGARARAIIKRILQWFAAAGISFMLLKTSIVQTGIGKISDVIHSVEAPKDSVSFNTTTFYITPFDGCAAWTHDQVKSVVGTEGRNELNLYGDAWTSTNNMVEAGSGSYVYNVFNEKAPNINDKDSITAYIKSKIKSGPKISTSELKAGDIINLFYEGSAFTVEAFKNGKGVYSTHLGIVKQTKDGRLVIEHNIHGVIHTDEIQNVLDGKVRSTTGHMYVVAVARPDYAKLGFVIVPPKPSIPGPDGKTPIATLSVLLAFLKKRREDGHALTPEEIEQVKARIKEIDEQLAAPKQEVSKQEPIVTAPADPYLALIEQLPDYVLDTLSNLETIQKGIMQSGKPYSYDTANAAFQTMLDEQVLNEDTVHQIVIKQKEYLTKEFANKPKITDTTQETVPNPLDMPEVSANDITSPSEPSVPVINGAINFDRIRGEEIAQHISDKTHNGLKNNTASIKYEQIEKTGTTIKDGKVVEVTNHKYIPLYDQLDEKSNHNVLVPGAINEGDELEFRVDTAFDGQIAYDKMNASDSYGIPDLRPDKFSNHTTESGKIIMNSEADGFANVPIQIVHVKSGAVIGYVPRTDWITAKYPNAVNWRNIEDNIVLPSGEVLTGNVEAQKNMILAVRKTIAQAHNAGKGQTIKSKVTERTSSGHIFYNTEVKDTVVGEERYKLKSMLAKNLLPDTSLQYGIISGGTVFTSHGVELDGDKNFTQESLTRTFGGEQNGIPVVILPMPNGRWSVSPLRTRQLEQRPADINTVQKVIETYLVAGTAEQTDEHAKIIERIKEATSHNGTARGLDITDEKDLATFIGQYFSYTTKFGEVHTKADAKVLPGKKKKPQFLIDIPSKLSGENKSRIKIGTTFSGQSPMYASLVDGRLSLDFEDALRTGLATRYKNITYTKGDIRGINDNRPFNSIIIQANGETRVTKHDNYNEYLKSFADTIVYGKHRITKDGKEAGPKEKGTYVYGANPVINFDFNPIVRTSVVQDQESGVPLPDAPKKKDKLDISDLLLSGALKPNSSSVITNQVGSIEDSQPATLENLTNLQKRTPVANRNEKSAQQALDEMHSLGITDIAPNFNPFLKC